MKMFCVHKSRSGGFGAGIFTQWLFYGALWDFYIKNIFM